MTLPFTTPQLIIGVVVALVLILLPVAAFFGARWLIPLNPPDGAAPAGPPESSFEFTSLQNFWESNLPHLRELRDRLVICLIAIAIGTAVGFWLVSDSSPLGTPLVQIMINAFVPKDISLQGTAVMELFTSQLGVALVAGIA